MNISKYKVLFYYKNLNLWKNITITNLKKKKWNNLKNNIKVSRGKYIYHYKKLKIENLYYYKFVNKQILRKYLTNYKDSEFKNILKNNYFNFEKRLDYNLYHANFVNSLYAAKFFITKGCVFVNKKCITSFNYILKKNDIVEINSIFFNYILNNSKYSFNKNTYIRNLEIDYKTFSFIFLDNPNYYILNYNNFIKKIYINQPSIYNSDNIFNYSNAIYNIRNKYNYNNYFNFFKHIYIYYLWLDKKNQYFKFKHIYYNQNYSLKILSKLLQKKYNNYYFRNILLKRIFNYKYNYLKFLQKTKVFNNFSTFENINNILNTNLHFVDHSNNLNNLNNEFFKYIYTLIFQYYIFLLKNYYVSNFVTSNLNNYSYFLIFNKDIFKVINIKNKLNNYINYQYSTDIIFFNKNFKTINAKFIKNYKFKKKNYRRPFIYKKLICYILSKKYKYRIYRKCHSFRQNKLKRLYLITKLQKSFIYTRFNCNNLGKNVSIITSRNIYNKLLNNSNIKNSSFLKNYKIENLYYPKYGKIYNIIFKTLITSVKSDKQNLIQNRYKIWKLRKQFSYLKNTKDIKNYLYLYECNLSSRLNFLKYNKTQTNLNYNLYYKNTYLLKNLINYYIINTKNINYNLTKLNQQIVYKMHNILCLNQYQSFNNKKYKRLAFYYRRFLLNYYYLNYNKNKTLLASNLHKYFLLNKSFENKDIKLFYNNYKHYYIKKRKQYFNLIYHYRYLNYKRKNLNKQILKNNKINRKYIKFNRVYYLIKNRKNKLSMIKLKSLNQNLFYYFNLNLINSNLKFKDNLFYIDLILNLYIRKLNTTYNKFNYKEVNYSYSKKYNKLNIKRATNYKTLKYNINSLKNYIFKSYNYYNLQNSRIFLNNKTILLKNNINSNFYKYTLNYKIYKYLKKNKQNIYRSLNKKTYITNMYKIYLYYTFNVKKYKLIKYIFKNYIFKEYAYFINILLSNINIKTYNKYYIKQMYYNLLFSQLFNLDKFDYILKNNFKYSRHLKIIINYFIIINRLYK